MEPLHHVAFARAMGGIFPREGCTRRRFYTGLRLRELAGDFHTWYNAHKTLVDDQPLRDARLALSEAVRQVIANGLDLLGVSAPEQM